ncbi:MAG: hypothetical protein H0V39_06140 [Nitrosomonas sp.]|nr:hypothetical protein [Nitrosomonas sp.]
MIGVILKIVAYQYHRFREVANQASEDDLPFAGDFEANESYFDGSVKETVAVVYRVKLRCSVY